MSEEDSLVFNGINGTTGDYGIPPLTPKTMASRIADEPDPSNKDELIKKHQQWEKQLTPSKWGWNPKMGYKHPGFGKPKPYHNPAYRIR